MRRASFAPAFVVSVSVVACSRPSGVNPPGPEPAPQPTTVLTNPPEPQPEPEPTPQPTAEIPVAHDDGGAAAKPDPDPNTPPRVVDFPTTLNPRDGEGRTIKRMWQGDQCFVDLPFPPLKPGEHRRPGASPPSQVIACPASMLSPTYEQCRGGVVRGKNDGSACVCLVNGNPPPPVRRAPCPTK